jgi:hypothetical protein
VEDEKITSWVAVCIPLLLTAVKERNLLFIPPETKAAAFLFCVK